MQQTETRFTNCSGKTPPSDLSRSYAKVRFVVFVPERQASVISRGLLLAAVPNHYHLCSGRKRLIDLFRCI